MKISVVTQYSSFLKNKLFQLDLHDIEPYTHNSHWMLKPWSELYQLAKNRGIELNTYDLLNPEKADGVLLIDLHLSKNEILHFQKLNPTNRWVLMNLESPLFNAHGLSGVNHGLFDKVLTYDQSLISNSKYIAYKIPFEVPDFKISNIPFEERKLPCIVNKYQTYGLTKRFSYLKRIKKLGWKIPAKATLDHLLFPKELYTLRAKVVQSFEKKFANQFDIFGNSWNSPCSKGACNRSKLEILEKYRFNICPENVQNDSHYISEKIFDSIFSGAVPVYLGFDRVNELIPKDIFISISDFKNEEYLVTYLSDMDVVEWTRRREIAHQWLLMKKYLEFDSKHFSNSLLSA